MKGAASIPRKGSRGCADFINQDGLSSFFGKEQHMSNPRIEFVSINALMLQVNMINYNRLISITSTKQTNNIEYGNNDHQSE